MCHSIGTFHYLSHPTCPNPGHSGQNNINKGISDSHLFQEKVIGNNPTMLVEFVTLQVCVQALPAAPSRDSCPGAPSGTDPKVNFLDPVMGPLYQNPLLLAVLIAYSFLVSLLSRH